MTEASGVPPSDRTTVTMRWAHGWTAPTKPAPRASRRAILQLLTRPRGRSVNRVSATNRASVRVSFMSAATVARARGGDVLDNPRSATQTRPRAGGGSQGGGRHGEDQAHRTDHAKPRQGRRLLQGRLRMEGDPA